MILDKTIKIKVAWQMREYYKSLGYNLNKQSGRGTSPEIFVFVSHLKKNSNIYVRCFCEGCFKIYKNRYNRNVIFCSGCLKKNTMFGNSMGSSNKGKVYPQLRGEKSPRWNKNKKDFISYSTRVRWLSELTYRKYKDILNPNDYPRTLNGVNGGYQLDHINSIKYCFENNVSIEDCSDISNLQLLSWQDNREKWV